MASDEPPTTPVPLTYDEVESCILALQFQMSASHDDDIQELIDKLRRYQPAAMEAR